MTITKKGESLYLRKRVPARFKAVEPRDVVWIALRTDSPSEALARSGEAWAQMVLGWEALLKGQTGDAAARYAAAREIAQSHGFRFLPADAVAKLPIAEFTARLEACETPDAVIDPVLASGILGLAEKPAMRLSDVLDTYWTLPLEEIEGKSEDQMRRWRNPRIKAFKNLIGVLGDVPISELSPEHLLTFRRWWWDKLKREGLTKNSANKDFAYVSSTLRRVNADLQLGLTLRFDQMAFADTDRATRKPFSSEWIKEKLLAPGALDGLNLEARCILLGMVNTGYRPSEAQGILPHHIHLDGPVPYIEFRPEGRQLKTATSARNIPLAGISLEAFKLCPDGFPRYRDKATLSDTVNKFLRENGLLQTPDHSLYGLRHSFEDRLLGQNVDERIRRDLMGHALDRQRYGEGASLEQLHKIIQSIAL